MKKTFTTILSLIYLFSCIGFGSVQIKCQNVQELKTPGESQCCSSESISHSSKTSQRAVNPEANSCGVMMVPGFIGNDEEMTFPNDCCDIQSKYNQLDNSFLPLNINLSHDARTSGELYYDFPQHKKYIDRIALLVFVDSSIHVNFPLLN